MTEEEANRLIAAGQALKFDNLDDVAAFLRTLEKHGITGGFDELVWRSDDIAWKLGLAGRPFPPSITSAALLSHYARGLKERSELGLGDVRH